MQSMMPSVPQPVPVPMDRGTGNPLADVFAYHPKHYDILQHREPMRAPVIDLTDGSVSSSPTRDTGATCTDFDNSQTESVDSVRQMPTPPDTPATPDVSFGTISSDTDMSQTAPCHHSEEESPPVSASSIGVTQQLRFFDSSSPYREDVEEIHVDSDDDVGVADISTDTDSLRTRTPELQAHREPDTPSDIENADAIGSVPTSTESLDALDTAAVSTDLALTPTQLQQSVAKNTDTLSSGSSNSLKRKKLRRRRRVPRHRIIVSIGGVDIFDPAPTPVAAAPTVDRGPETEGEIATEEVYSTDFEPYTTDTGVSGVES
ncbi:MAG: hypothetical protein MHM6MM_007978 [Cercozoa sp. M6MM]